MSRSLLRASGLCLLATITRTGLAQAPPDTAVHVRDANSKAAVAALVAMYRAADYEILFDGNSPNPHGPDVVVRNKTLGTIHAVESKANRASPSTFHGHLQGSRNYAVESARAALRERGLTEAQRRAYEQVVEAGQSPLKLKTYVARVEVRNAQAGTPAIQELKNELSTIRTYSKAGKVVLRGIALVMIAKDVTDGARKLIELERLYDDGQIDEFNRDMEQIKAAAKTGGQIAGALAGVWLGAKAGAALGSLAGWVAGPVGAAVGSTVGAVVVGIACYVGGETVTVAVTEFTYQRFPETVQAGIDTVRATYAWVERQVAWAWEGSWAQYGYHEAGRLADEYWQGSWAQMLYHVAKSTTIR